MKKILLSLLVVLGLSMVAQRTHAQSSKELFKKQEDSMMRSVDSMNRVAIYDERLDYCHVIIKKLSQILKAPNSFEYPFDELAKKIHIIYPEDKSFRIFNWPVEYRVATFRYYGAIQMADGTVYPLIDNSEEIGDKDLQNVLTNRKWYGQEYYRILTETGTDGKPVYFLFGINLGGDNVSLKMMDVLSFDKGGVIFGGDYFGNGNKRFVMEYQKGAQASLNFDKERNMVVYNVLESEVNQPLRKNSLVPTGDLDGLKWENGYWQVVKNLIPIVKLKDGQAPINGVVPTN